MGHGGMPSPWCPIPVRNAAARFCTGFWVVETASLPERHHVDACLPFKSSRIIFTSPG
jgi:hypothetical protein